MHNLFIAYDLNDPGQNYDAVLDRIKSLGRWYKFQYSLFYLHTALTAQQVYGCVRQVMDANDALVVMDTTLAVTSPLPFGDVEAINAVWFNRMASMIPHTATADG
jgi:hypothetical protein